MKGFEEDGIVGCDQRARVLMGTHDVVKGSESRFFYGFISWAVGESFIESF